MTKFRTPSAPQMNCQQLSGFPAFIKPIHQSPKPVDFEIHLFHSEENEIVDVEQTPDHDFFAADDIPDFSEILPAFIWNIPHLNLHPKYPRNIFVGLLII
jgi:hypothetical protein